jgi:cell division septum initiation protein DivIVA
MMEELDPFTDLMAKQLQALLKEKSKLAQENARLERENDSLHNILSYSLAAQDEDDDGEERAPAGSWVSDTAIGSVESTSLAVM